MVKSKKIPKDLFDDDIPKNQGPETRTSKKANQTNIIRKKIRGGRPWPLQIQNIQHLNNITV